MTVNERKLHPLTHPQRRIWLTEQLYPDTTVHNLGGAVHIKGKLDIKILEQAILMFIKQHDVFHLKFVLEQDNLFQVFEHCESDSVAYYDFRHYEQLAKEKFDTWSQKKFKEKFSILKDKLYYFAIFQISDEEIGYFSKFHHIISDGWSINIMTKQIAENYTRIASKSKDTIEVPSKSYMTLYNREQKYENSPRFDSDRTFWLERLGDLEGYALPKSSRSTEGSRLSFHLSQEQTAKIHHLITLHKCSLNTLFLLLISIIFKRNYEIENVIVGLPILNRSGAHEKNIFGMFTSTMPYPVPIDWSVSFGCLLSTLQSDVMSYFSHQRYPYNLLVQEMELRKKGIENIYQVCINYYNTKLVNSIENTKIENVEYYSGNQTYSLQLIIKEWEEHLTLQFDYKNDDYSEAEIYTIFGQINHLLSQLFIDSSTIVDQLEVISDEEFRNLIYDVNKTETYYPNNTTIHQLFEKQADLTPDDIALEYNGKQLAYRELDNWANHVANDLRLRGVERGSIVGILTEHSFEMIVALLAVLKAGGAYLPIDKDYPLSRIDYMLKDAKVRVLITNIELSGGLDFEGVKYAINKAHFDFNGPSAKRLDSTATAEDLVYLIYTSGSTGNPKGTVIQHRGLVNYIWWAKETYIKEKSETFALYSSLAFDLTVTSIFTPLINGNRILIYPPHSEDFVLYTILKENRTNILKLTPAHLSLIQELELKDSNIRCLIVGGEELKTKLSHRIIKAFRSVEIYNEYGPTEAIVGCMIYKFNPDIDVCETVPIGSPINNQQVYILDKNLKPKPVGLKGEIFISGDGISLGYMNQIKLTQEKFVENPFIPGKLMYKSGDLGRRLSNDVIEYLGRIDHQVNLNGFRIELGEIQHRLLQHPLVQEALVVMQLDVNQKAALCAYLIADPTLSDSECRRFLANCFPSYMIPRYYVFLETYPLTVNGKIDRAALPKPQQQYKKSEEEYINDTEHEVAMVYAKVLGANQVRPTDDFFQLGGDSIKAIQISSRLKEIGYSVSVKEVMERLTVREIVSHLIVENNHCVRESPGLCQGEICKTPIIEWFLNQNFKNPHQWNQSVTLSLNKRISVNDLSQIIEAIILHHDSLRINYDFITDRLFYNENHIHFKHQDTIFSFDLSNERTEEMQKHRMSEILENVHQQFILNSSLLFKACLFDFGANHNQQLVFIAHHIVVDGVSWRIVLNDFSKAWEMVLSKEPIVLPNKTNSFQEWANQFARRDDNTSKENCWRINHESDEIKNADGATVQTKLGTNITVTRYVSPSLTHQWINKAHRAFHTRPHELLIAATSFAIGQIFDKNQIILELESHGREEDTCNLDVSRTVGWFTRMYPVHLPCQFSDKKEGIIAVKEILRKTPTFGDEYGKTQQKCESEDMPDKKIRFNYLGSLDNKLWDEYFSLKTLHPQVKSGKENHLTCFLEIVSYVLDQELVITVTYNEFNNDLLDIDDLVNKIIQNLTIIVDLCSTAKDPHFTPSDFATIELSQQSLDLLFD
ncbi:non-ribosomal peptide synthetase [Paenibacillus apiarius]|uniref:Non-ribosomal peptide synthetase n=1 Tax=Paenibacillus apiarius TaxID=46240 RepID=A0ABT4DSL7_9BACL|nr:non-ribosomal peptide synthetase [Paenibacillus apiarius]MCY9517573.1 non-ribosomal peptide synthetase [Paenibacillus apiarius]MCY9519780.1 non-ribosomal peptide synthetase [Paenibacillus apiarius]MCY9555017.1 non-ribosomal peptide synthetase [Paenibacillus apiarius]MCY9559335.1 non-ribosomal peptide synthetase [Paenibacillus apiarius]MCY9682694.1 non-ribosomal peptide synthetase [Paenibacillus apiarius]